MRKYSLILVFLLITVCLSASIKVEYNSSLPPEIIQTVIIDSIHYFNAFELNKTFKATIQEDFLDQRLRISIYNEQIIILLESSYLSFADKTYNFRYPVISRQGKYYIPLKLITDILPLIFPDKISYKNGSIIADKPVDNSIKTIVLDPGHGGKDPGAVGFTKKNLEKDVVLKVARKVKDLIETNLNIRVILTRENDSFVSLQERTLLANRENADLFVSLHCNANNSHKYNGIEVYYLSTAKTDEARAVETLENSVVYDYEGGEEAVKRYDDLALILADMAQNEHLIESYDLSGQIQENIVNKTNGRNRGVKQANFYVLRGAYMPSVLIEMGFISNPEEEKKLVKDDYQNKIAEAIYAGIRNFKFKYDQMQ